MTWAILPDDAHLRAMQELSSAQSDRILAVVGGALLDQAVSRTLRERFRKSDVTKTIIDSERPLGNLGPKIDVLFLLYAIEEKERAAMKSLSRIRNTFAHNLDATFDSEDGAFKKELARLVLHENRTHYPHHLYGPDSEYAIEPVKTNRARFLVNLKMALILLMRDRLSHEPNTNRQLTPQEVHERYGELKAAQERAKQERQGS